MKHFINAVRQLLGLALSQEEKLKAETAKQQIRVNLEERAGQLYIVYTDGLSERSQAFTSIDKNITVKEALELLEATRRAAVEYNTSN